MLYAPLTSPMSATCLAHLILLALITLTILGEEYKQITQIGIKIKTKNRGKIRGGKKMRFEVLIAIISMLVFWVVTP
jgi:hypothetical protein